MPNDRLPTTSKNDSKTMPGKGKPHLHNKNVRRIVEISDKFDGISNGGISRGTGQLEGGQVWTASFGHARRCCEMHESNTSGANRGGADRDAWSTLASLAGAAWEVRQSVRDWSATKATRGRWLEPICQRVELLPVAALRTRAETGPCCSTYGFVR